MGGEIFRTCPDRPWGPPSLLYSGYRFFPGGKERPGRDTDHSPLLVPWSCKGRVITILPLRDVGLYRASVPVQGCTLPYLFICKTSTRTSAHPKGENTFKGITESKEELFCTGFAFVWKEQQKHNLKRTIKPVKERYNDIVRQNMLTELSENSSLTTYMKFKGT